MLKEIHEPIYNGQAFPPFSSIFTVFYQVHWETHRLKKKVFAEKLGVHPDTITNWMNYATNRPSSEKIIEAGHTLGLSYLAIDVLLMVAGYSVLYGSTQEQVLGFARMVENGGYSDYLRGAMPAQIPGSAPQPIPSPSNRESRQTHIYDNQRAYIAQDNSTLQVQEGPSKVLLIIFGIIWILVLLVIARLGYQTIQTNRGTEAIPAPPMSSIYVRDPSMPDVNEALDIVDGELINQRVMEYKDKINYLSTATRSEVKAFYDEKLAEDGWTIAKHEDLEYALALAYGNPDDKWRILVAYVDLRSYGRDDALVLVWQAKERGE